jgi:hypothetical protein
VPWTPLGATGPALIEVVGAALGPVPILALARTIKRTTREAKIAVTHHRENDANELQPAAR